MKFTEKPMSEKLCRPSSLKHAVLPIKRLWRGDVSQGIDSPLEAQMLPVDPKVGVCSMCFRLHILILSRVGFSCFALGECEFVSGLTIN